jgi:hypothetical protein
MGKKTISLSTHLSVDEPCLLFRSIAGSPCQAKCPLLIIPAKTLPVRRPPISIYYGEQQLEQIALLFCELSCRSSA